MDDFAISVRGLRKAYRRYAHPRDMLVEMLTRRSRHLEFVALDNISFDVKPGSVVGLLGRNGAGKSTLLRVIAGTLDATAGTIETRGRIAAILELGTGFHPEYSGRENIYLGGLCLGLSRREIDQRVDEIIDFSELRSAIDQPFRTFSSGMQARLAFSVATCVDPDILIVDEALSVGDARFQLKSFDRIRDFKRRGKSILVVSHNINQVVSICDRAILLERGKISMDGDPNQVGNAYHELLFAPTIMPSTADPSCLDEAYPDEAEGHKSFGTGAVEPELDAGQRGSENSQHSSFIEPPLSADGRERRYGDGVVRIVKVCVLDSNGREVRRLKSTDSYTFVATLRATARTTDLVVGFLLRDLRGADVFGTDTSLHQFPIAPIEKGEELRVLMQLQANLGAGTYFITAAVARPDTHKHDMRFDALEIDVDVTPILFTSSIVNPIPEFRVEKVINPRRMVETIKVV